MASTLPFAGRHHPAARNLHQRPPRAADGYLTATRHPLASLLFLSPLLFAYEAGVIWVGGDRAEAVRTGADSWLRWILESFGVQQLFLIPFVIITTLLAWSWLRRGDRPRDLVGVCTGMGMESVVYAMLLWRLSKELGPLLDRCGIVLAPSPRPGDALARLISFVGAGIYEETLFRLVLFSALAGLLQAVALPRLAASILGAVAASLAFAAVHHIGPYGEPMDGFVFLFRTLAGFYFTGLYLLRGFGVAVGTHACYDIIVGIAVG